MSHRDDRQPTIAKYQAKELQGKEQALSVSCKIQKKTGGSGDKGDGYYSRAARKMGEKKVYDEEKNRRKGGAEKWCVKMESSGKGMGMWAL